MNAANLQLSPEEMALVMNPDWILTKNSIINKAIVLFAGLGEEWRHRWDSCGSPQPADPHPPAVSPSHVPSAGPLARPASEHPASSVDPHPPAVSPDSSPANPQQPASGPLAPPASEHPTSLSSSAAPHPHAFSPDAPPANPHPPSSLPPHPVPRSLVASPRISRGENYLGLPYVMLDYPRVFGREDILAIRTMFWWGHSFTVTLHLKGSYKDLFLPVIREHWAHLAQLGFHVGVSEDEWRHEHAPDNYRPLADVSDLVVETPFLKLSAAWGLDRWSEAQSGLTGLYAALVAVLGTLIRPGSSVTM